MEEQADEQCHVVYFCASAGEDVSEVYHSSSPPGGLSAGKALSALDVVKQNARLLLDRDQGGFDEGAQCHMTPDFPPD